MVGRMSYQNVWELVNADQEIFKSDQVKKFSREEVLTHYAYYIDYQIKKNPNLNFNVAIKPILSVYNGERGNKFYR